MKSAKDGSFSLPRELDPTKILTEFQRRFLRDFFSDEEVAPHFFFTGGTALSAYYLAHRFSDDLDLFTLSEERLDHAWRTVRRDLARVKYRTETVIDTKDEKRLRIREEENSTPLVIDLHRDYGPHFGEIKVIDGIRVDSLLNMAVNKFLALWRRFRYEIKDYVDIYFLLTKAGFSYEELKELADQKEGGFEEYIFAAQIRAVSELQKLPKMLIPLTHRELEDYFLELSDSLLERHAPPSE